MQGSCSERTGDSICKSYIKRTSESILRDLAHLEAEQETGRSMPGDEERIEALKRQLREAEKEEPISAVLVTYNRAKFLPLTLESLLNQTCQNFELLICDDCSTDETPSVCREYERRYPDKITYIRNDRNLSMPGNLNQGIRRARYNLIAILHDGDLYHETILEKWRQALIDNPHAAFVFNGYRHLSPDGDAQEVRFGLPLVVGGPEFLEFCFRDKHVECPVWGTVMLRRNQLAEIGYFDPRYSFWADVDTWFRLASRSDVAYIDECLIDLPSRKTMPHLFSEPALVAHRQVFRAYWNARCRHYQGPRLVAALAQHVGWFASERAKRLTKRVLRHAIPST